jgi:hypothetical protein
MSTLVKVILSVALLLSIVVPFIAYIKGEQSKKRYKKILGLNILLFFGIMLYSAVLVFSSDAYAAGEAASSANTGFGYIAAALSTGLACIGGGIAVSAAASAALGAVSEDSSILGKSLIFIGLAEGVCLYGLIISFMILGKL